MASSLSTKLVRIGTSLLSVALVSIGLTLWVTWQLEGGAAAVNEAGRLRMQTWRLVSAIQADSTDLERVRLIGQIDQSLTLLRRGDPSRPLFVPWESEVRQRFSSAEATWVAQRPHWESARPSAHQRVRDDATHFSATVDGLVFAIETHLASLTAVLNLFQFVMLTLAIGGAVVMLYTGYLYVISPLSQVQKGLQRVQSGDFAARIEVPSQDEFGQVAAGFNRMTHTLQSLYTGLEAQVEAKTQDLQAQRQRLETLYSVSAFLAQASTVDELSKGFAQRVREAMKADAVAVRWSDEANQRYLMLASDCFPAELAAEERSVVAGACACGGAKNNTGVRVIPIRSFEPSANRACARLGFTSVVTVPVLFQQRAIGEMDLFYRGDVNLSVEETELLDALGAHLASALESLRAAALEREAAAGEERSFLARELHDSIAQSLAFLKIQTQLLRGAIHRQQPEQVQKTLDELDEGLKESIADVRELLLHFRTRTRSEDIEGALQETLQKFQHQTAMPTRLDIAGDGLPLPPDVQVHVLHIVQEALSNVRKHAGATSVAVNVTKGHQWVFEVVDDGEGFDTTEIQGATHVGMKIMRERAQRIHADVAVTSLQGRGTRVTLKLPDVTRLAPPPPPRATSPHTEATAQPT